MKEIVEKLSEIQRKLNAPKNQFNNFGKYHYRNCEDILEGLKPHLNDCTVTVSDDIQVIGERVYVKATATFMFGNESISNSAFAREPQIKKGMDESQITGSASSYARKYALGGLFLVDDNKDADSMDNRNTTSQVQPKSDLIQVLSEGNDFNSAKFWRSLTSEQQECEWKKLDKDAQKNLKSIMSQVPMENK